MIVNEQTFSVKLPKSWIPVSSTGMTRRGYLDKKHCPPGRPKLQCSYSYGCFPQYCNLRATSTSRQRVTLEPRNFAYN
ncbi:hypothetical protein COM43_002035 [Wolbachia pipientis]|uniref:Uncharacterized protein n=1 Tax=Wolbachia pipientis TaxID=955 RepID=A0A6C1U591_WOLPI|nr:hypothetical protein COM43_002035 [Wolbachia pipientis]TVS97915.1 hypothetical protein COM42_001615 [Wolbachia pipientis]